jgi:molecular chaperone GrpE
MSDENKKKENNDPKKDAAGKDEGELKNAAAAAKAEAEEGPIDTADDLKQQLDAQSDRYLRLMAEFDNFKKRVSRDYERLVESANEKLIGELIDVRENFERALKAGESATDPKAIYDGMKLIYSKFDAILDKNGLEPFGKPLEVFDPQLHDAMMKVPSDTIAEDHIVEVFEKGYNLKTRVIRHAKVIVSAGKQNTPPDSPEKK